MLAQLRFLLVALLLGWCDLGVRGAEKSIKHLIQQLGNGTVAEREQAANQLVDCGSAALEPLRTALKHAGLETAGRARECIEAIERASRLDALMHQLRNDPDPKRRLAAVRELRGPGTAARRAGTDLIKALDDPDIEVRTASSVALARTFHPPIKEAAPRMLAILKDPKEPDELRASIALSLKQMEGCEQEAVPVLLEILNSKNWEMRTCAASALGSLGREHPAVVPALLKALKDPHVSVQGNAAGALGILGKEPEKAVLGLTETLQSFKDYLGDNDPRQAILRALGQFGKQSTPAVPAIQDLLTSLTSKPYSSRKTRLAGTAIQTLGEIGSAARVAVPQLKALQRGDLSIELEEVLDEALLTISGP